MLRNDYSWTDTALTFGATLLLAVMAVTSLALRYVTSPITCWMPEGFTMLQAHYVHDVCYRREQIITPIPELIPFGNEGFAQPTYHQWVPFALGVGAVLCLLPHVAWCLLSGPLLLDTHALLSSVLENQRQAAERRHVLLRDTAILLHSTLKRGNSLLTVAALCRKLLACVTCLVQLVLVVILFRPQLSAKAKDDHEAGDPDDAAETSNRNGSLPLPYGPFLCRLTVKQLHNAQKWAIQCTLPINQVYSRGFTFLFYLFLLLAVLCTLDLLLWAARVMVPGLRDAAVQRHLEAACGGEGAAAVCQPLYPRFAQWLGWDGRLLLALTADYCGPLAAADLAHHLWVAFKGAPRSAVPLAHFPAPTAPASVGASKGGGAYVGGDPAAIPLMSVTNCSGTAEAATVHSTKPANFNQ